MWNARAVRRYALAALLAVPILSVLVPASPATAKGAAPGHAAGLDGRADLPIPDPLRPWIGWVLHDQEEALCPPLHGVESEGTRCVWPSALALNLDNKGGRFTGRWRLFRRGFVTLPGDGKTWPQEVRVDGKPAVVAIPPGSEEGDAEDDRPAVLLEPGDHSVTGVFLLDELPESLAVPNDTGLLQVTVNGERLALPIRDDEGRVFLRRAADAQEAEVLEVTVHRLLTDGVPVRLTTRIELRVSGKGREVQLARPLPKGFVPMALQSPLPARLEKDGTLRVQVRAGNHTLDVEARHEGVVKELTLAKPDGPWADAEVWAFQAAPALRVVNIEGLAPIDPQQTTLPAAWRRLPCYPMRPGDTMRLSEGRRGDADPTPDQLRLDRKLWLDFDGKGFTARDRLSGSLRRAWRLEVDPVLHLGRVAVAGQDQLITRGRTEDGGRSGVEIRQGNINVEADLRLVRDGVTLPASGWHGDLHGMTAELNLPPGWRLLHISGVDDVSETWLRRWSLLDLFLVLVFSMAIGRLFGLPFGILSLLTLALCLPESDAPRIAWLPVLAAVALLRVLPEGWLRGAMRVFLLVSQVVLVLISITFAAQHVRRSLYPALDHGGQDGGNDGWLSRGDMSKRAEAPMEQSIAVSEDMPRAPSGSPDAPPEPEKAEAKEKVQADDFKQLRKMDERSGSPRPKAAKAAKNEAIDGDALGGLLGTGKGGGGTGEGTIGLGSLGTIGRGSGGKSGLYGIRGPQQRQQMQQEMDPKAVIQTGPGLPRWNWATIPLHFSGPVEASQTLHLYLMPPGVNLILGLLRVALLTLLLLKVLNLGARLPGLRRLGLFLLPLFVVLSGGSARADQLPNKEILDELRERLLKPAECQPRCAASQRLLLQATPGALRLRLEIGAAATTAVPLPGDAAQWLPSEVLLDGRPAAALRAEDGKLWLQVPVGNHQVVLSGPLPDRDTVQLSLPLKPHRVEVQQSGWRVDGVHEDATADDDLQLSREGRGPREAKSTLQPEALPPFLLVERELQIGLKWQVVTRVQRVTPTGTAALLEVPLLPGESVTTPEVRVRAGKALVNLAPGATEVTWHSLLQEQSPLVLSAQGAGAAGAGAFAERWRLDLSPLWHVELSGIPQVQPQGQAPSRRPEWQPWPGEQVTLTLSRPAPVPGQSLTIDRAQLQLRPGLRATDATLELRLRASRGGQHTVTLPRGAQLQQLTTNGEILPIRPEGDKVSFPVRPGAQETELTWREPTGIGLRYVTPSVDLGAPGVNAGIEVRLGTGRWVLLAGGPRLGPAVLFWGFVLVVLLLALGLSRVRMTPLSGWDWLLLGLGLTQVSITSGALLFGFWLALGWRKEHAQLSRRWLFNLRQLALCAWAVAAVVVLFDAVHAGLLGEPDMQISGYGSTASNLRWFADRIDGAMPRAFVVSLPMWAYRVVMLLWALWLAQALLRWLRWGYGAMGQGGLWQRPAPGERSERRWLFFRRPAAPATAAPTAETKAAEPPAETKTAESAALAVPTEII